MVRRVLVVVAAVLMLGGTGALAQSQLADLQQRIDGRSQFPSIFQAWSPADNMAPESKLDTLARHDLYWHGPTAFSWDNKNLVWDVPGGNSGYWMTGTSLTSASITAALQDRSALLAKNPNMVMIAEIRYGDALDAWVPADSTWWLRDAQGNRILGWDPGNGQKLYKLDINNADFRAHVAAQAAAAVQSGVFDGVFLDCWSENDNSAARLDMMQRVRAAIGEQALLIANLNERKPTYTAPYLNGVFVECCDMTTRANWLQIADALRYDEKNLKPNSPVVNCLRGIWQASRNDLNQMRATTTLGLTQSNGYTLFSDPNELATGDQLHNWYSFYNTPLGRPARDGVVRPDGSARREFVNGTVLYNTMGNAPRTVTFKENRTSAATGLTGKTFSVNGLDGDIFLLPTGYTQKPTSQVLASNDLGNARGASKTVTVSPTGAVTYTSSGTAQNAVGVFAGGSVVDAIFKLTEDQTADAGRGGAVGALKFEVVKAPTNPSWFGFNYLHMAMDGLTPGQITMDDLDNRLVEFDYLAPVGVTATVRGEPTGATWNERIDFGQTLVGTGQWVHFARTMSSGDNLDAFLAYINGATTDYRLTFTNFNTATTGDTTYVDNLRVTLTGMTLIADANGDSAVDFADLQVMQNHWGMAGAGLAGGDYNADGIVSRADFDVLQASWTDNPAMLTGIELPPDPVPTPEPATLTLLALGLAGVVRFARRRSR